MMIKRMIVFLVAIAAVFAFSACNKVNVDSETKFSDIVDETVEVEETEEEPAVSEFSFEIFKHISIPETVVYKDDDVTVTMVELSWNDNYGLELFYRIEDAHGRNLQLFTGRGVAIDDKFMLPIDMKIHGSGLNALRFIPRMLEEENVRSVQTILGCDMSIVNSDTYETVVHDVAFLICTDNDLESDEAVEKKGWLIDKSGVKAYSCGLIQEFNLDMLGFYLQNDTDETVELMIDNLYIDGELVDEDEWYVGVAEPHTSSYAELLVDIIDHVHSVKVMEEAETLMFDVVLRSVGGEDEIRYEGFEVRIN